MPLVLIVGAGLGELGAAAAAASATAAGTIAAPVLASTAAAPVLMAAPVAEGIAAAAAPEIIGAAAAPVAEGIATPLAEGAVNPALTQAGPAPQVPQGIDASLNVQGGIDQTLAQAANPSVAPPGTPSAPPFQDVTSAEYAKDMGNIYGPSPASTNVMGEVTQSAVNYGGSYAPQTASSGLQKGFESALKFTKDHPLITSLGIQAAGKLMDSGGGGAPPKKTATRKDMSGFNASSPSTVGYNPIYQPTPYAEGGIAYAVGGPVEQMSAENAISGNMMYPQSQLQTPMYSNPMVQRPMPTNVINSGIDTPVDAYTGEMKFAEGGVTGNGNLNLNIPLDLGASGIAQGGGAGGYSAGSGQTSTLSTATGAPSQAAQQPTAQPPVAMAQAATAEPLNIQPRGRSYVPSVQWKQTVGGMGSMSRYDYTVGDSAADAYVKANAGTNLNLNQGQGDRAKIEDLYSKYYRGYAKGGTTKSEPNYSEMMGIRSAEQQKADEEYLQAFNKREMAGSINTDSDVDTAKQDPMHASMTRLKKIGKRVGIKPVELPKSAVTDANVFHAANGGIMHNLGGYSDGGRLLRGPGDGVSDSIPATIGNKQPARLADGEFVVPARIVSELGNGSTEAGARKLYQMMERVQADRKKSIGKGKVAVNSKATKHLPK